MKVIGIYRKCDLVTMLGTCFAVTGIIFAFNLKTIWAIFCLIFAAICDAFDGVVARRFKSLKDNEIYGIELDSLSDVISFGVLPAIIALNLINNNIYGYAVCIFFVLCGVIRLAYFNMLASTKKGSNKEFIGLPITASAIILPLVYFVCYLINAKYINIIIPITLLITGILFICPLKIKKPTFREKLILSVLGILAILIALYKIYF